MNIPKTFPHAVVLTAFFISGGFAAQAQTSANRFLQIAVKKPSEANYTILTPRQQLTASPYSIQSLSAKTADGLSANCLACVSNAQIDPVDGAKVSGTVTNVLRLERDSSRGGLRIANDALSGGEAYTRAFIVSESTTPEPLFPSVRNTSTMRLEQPRFTVTRKTSSISSVRSAIRIVPDIKRKSSYKEIPMIPMGSAR